jgi:alpha-tubulin suppressor-like RCC1 family protein
LTWGANNNNQLGIGATSTRNTSISIISTGSLTPISVTAGYEYVFAQTAAGAALAWGADDTGQLGDQSVATNRGYAVTVKNAYPNRTIAAVAPAVSHTVLLFNATQCFGLLTDDPFVCSERGVCVAEDTCLCQSQYLGSDCSITVCNGINSTDVTVCNGHGSCMPNDTCKCDDMWTDRYCTTNSYGILFGSGRNDHYQLAIGDTTARTILTKSKTTGVSQVPVKYVATGDYYALIVTNQEKIVGVGVSNYYQLSVQGGSTSDQSAAATFSFSYSNTSILSISAGSNFAGLVLADKRVLMWGDNTYGQLGLGISSGGAYSTPTPIFASVVGTPLQLSGTISHCLLVTREGPVYSWGSNA